MGFKLSFAIASVVFATILYTGYADNITCSVEKCVSIDGITGCATWDIPQKCKKDGVCIEIGGKAIQNTKNVNFTSKGCVAKNVKCDSMNATNIPDIQKVSMSDLNVTELANCRTCADENCNGSGANALHTTMAAFMVPIIVLISKAIL